MAIILQPVSHPSLGEIHVSDQLYAIGSATPPFSSLDVGIVGDLAPHHARLFVDAEMLYLVDLGSAGGTTRNGQRFGNRAVALVDSDTIGFGGSLVYRVKIDGPPNPAESRALPVALTLAPSGPATVANEIVVSRFPLLIGRDAELFTNCNDLPFIALEYLSRRHACLYLKDDGLYIEDLGSTNGTWVRGNRAKPHAELKLDNGDVVAFGSELLTYTVRLVPSAAAEAVIMEHTGPRSVVPTKHGNATSGVPTEQRDTTSGISTNHGNDAPDLPTESGVLKVDGTMYLTVADSFLNIFCDNVEEANKHDEPAPDNSPAGRKRQGFGRKVAAFSHELKEALGEPRSDRRRGGGAAWFAGTAVIVLAVGIGLYWYAAPEHEIRDLYEEQHYMESLRQADRYLMGNPDDRKVRALASKALIKATVPQWLARLDEQRYDEAEALLLEAGKLSRNNPDGLDILSVLTWIGDLERFVAQRGGIEAPLVLFSHEPVISSLLERRDDDVSEQNMLMARIADQVGAFAKLRPRISGLIGKLRNEQISYLKVIDDLKLDLAEQLPAGHWNEAREELAQFERRYPSIDGIETLRLDIDRLAQLRQAVEGKDLDKVLELHGVAYATPLVEKIARDWRAAELPPVASLESYREALNAWRAGDAGRARTVLEPLTAEVWGEMATVKLEHFSTVTRSFESLMAASESPDYGERLLDFYNTLDAEEDRHYINAIESDVQDQKQTALARADSLYQKAKNSWADYQSDGGINGLMRLEKTLSDEYRRRSEQLADAYAQAQRSVGIYELLHMETPPPARLLHNRIVREVRRQRQWLSDLAMVLNAKLLDSKLELIPDPGAKTL